MSRKRGLRHNAGKLRLDLVPPEVECMIAAVLGAATESGKYPERNWERGLTQEQLIGSIRRHLNKVQEDIKTLDEETMLPEFAMLLCNAAMLATLATRALTFEKPPSVVRWTEFQNRAVKKILERIGANNAT